VKKLFYDTYGDAVDTSSRMNSTGEKGQSQVLEYV
jgi:hypothetical protein